jgi:hypothetical protein
VICTSFWTTQAIYTGDKFEIIAEEMLFPRPQPPSWEVTLLAPDPLRNSHPTDLLSHLRGRGGSAI